MMNCSSELDRVQFDGTFYAEPTQFYQLWTTFVIIDRFTLPAIHCLMTSKKQDLYTAILEKINFVFLALNPSTVVFLTGGHRLGTLL